MADTVDPKKAFDALARIFGARINAEIKVVSVKKKEDPSEPKKETG